MAKQHRFVDLKENCPGALCSVAFFGTRCKPLYVSGTKQWYKSVFLDKYKVAHRILFFKTVLVSCNETVRDSVVRKTVSSLRKTVRQWAAGDQEKTGPEEANWQFFFFFLYVKSWLACFPLPSRPLQFLSINKNQNDGENTGTAGRRCGFWISST